MKHRLKIRVRNRKMIIFEKRVEMRKLLIVCFAVITTQVLFAQNSAWKTKDGWALRKAPGTKKYEKFFAIGFWAIPGYRMTRTPEKDTAYDKNEKIFINRTGDFNLGIIQSGFAKPYMNRFIKAIGTAEFPHALLTYENKFLNDNRADLAYYKMQQLRKDVNSGRIKDILNNTVSDLINNTAGDYIWAPIDEVANGRGWNFPPEALSEIYKQIKVKQPGTLVYTDIAGTGKGNMYLFESSYLKKYKNMPYDPPYDLLSKEAKEVKNYPLLGFNQAFDGRPLYEFSRGAYSYKKYGKEELKRLWFENMKETASGYKSGGDVFGLNAFIDFNAYPVLAAVTVDGIKAGVGKNVPVWLYFDGNAYAKGNQDIEKYVYKIKCQMYTSVIHGATGIMLWNDVTKDQKYYDPMLRLIKEIKSNQDIFKSKTVLTRSSGDLHFMIKKNGNKRYILATNTNTTGNVLLNYKNMQKMLGPLETVITEIK